MEFRQKQASRHTKEKATVRTISASRQLARGLGLALTASMAACGSPHDSAVGADIVVSDSSGVRIVSNLAYDESLTIRESLRIGVIDGNPDLQFDQIRSLAVDSTDGIWIVDSHESVRHYNASGEYVGRVGGLGGGPGEARGGYVDVWLGRGTVRSTP